MEGKEGAIEKLRNLVSEDKNLIVKLDDDRIFLRYLYYQNFDISKAYDQMKTIYKQKVDYYDWYAIDRTEKQDEILKKEIHTIMQPRDSLGRRIYVVKLGNIEVGEFQANEMSQVDDIWLEVVMDEPETQKNGIVFLIDMKGVSWKFMKYFTPHNCKVGSLKAESIPLQNIQFHIVNSGMLLNTMVSLVFPLLSKETKERIHFHKSNWDSLHQHISADALPEEYGGVLPTIDYEKNIEHFLKSKHDRLIELLGYGYHSNKAESVKNNS